MANELVGSDATNIDQIKIATGIDNSLSSNSFVDLQTCRLRPVDSSELRVDILYDIAWQRESER